MQLCLNSMIMWRKITQTSLSVIECDFDWVGVFRVLSLLGTNIFGLQIKLGWFGLTLSYLESFRADSCNKKYRICTKPIAILNLVSLANSLLSLIVPIFYMYIDHRICIFGCLIWTDFELQISYEKVMVSLGRIL